MQIHFYPIWPWPVIFLVGLTLAVLAYWTHVHGMPLRRLLLGLRWLAIALAVFAMVRPSLVFKKTLKQSSVLVVLADKSRSMTLRDTWNAQSRWEAMSKLLLDADPEFERLAQDVQIRRFVFDRSVSETPLAAEEPDGEKSALGDALQEVMQRTAGERLAGIILLSDGVSNTGISPATVARQLRGQKVPVYAFCFGEDVANEHVRDIAARTIVSSATAFAKNRMSVRAEFACSGFGNDEIPVQLKLDGVVQASGVLHAGSDGGRAVVDLSAIPERAGDVKVTVEAALQPDELLPGNNSVSTYVTVLAGGISVLHIEGKYRYWEPKFLRWALDQSPDIELSQLYILDPSNPQAKIDPELFVPGRFDVVILGDINSTYFGPPQLTALRQLVDQGAGLLMIGGYDSFGPGGWARTPLAEVLPVEMGPADPQYTQALKMVPTATGLRHFVLRLAAGEESNRQVWESLRPLDGGSSWKAAKAGARLLATTPEGIELLVEQDNGTSRSLAFAGDTTWRWRQNKDGILAHERFWRQLMLWLAHKEESGDAQVRVKLDRRRLAVGQRLPVEVRVEKPDGTVIEGAVPQAVVKPPQGAEVPLVLQRQGDLWRGSFWQSETPGDYSVRVAVTADSKTVGSKTVKFLVYDEDTEMRQLAADKQLLASLTQSTGGELHEDVELPKFVAALQEADLNMEVTKPVAESLWDRWELFFLFTLIITLEWVIRKRRGLP